MGDRSIMNHINTAHFQQNLPEYLNQAVIHQEVINVNTQNGNAILLSEEEYNSLKETLYLFSIPGIKERLLKDKDTPPEECIDFEW